METSILSKIKKLKNSSDSYSEMGNQAAAGLYADKVHSMLIEHKLTMSDVTATVVDDPISEEKITCDGASKTSRVWWTLALAGVVAKAHFCKAMGHTGRPEITFIGRNQDREVAVYMFHHLARVMQASAKEALKRVPGARGFKKSFYSGFIASIAQRYREIEGRAKGHSQEMSLVLNNDEAHSWMKKHYATARKQKEPSTRGWDYGGSRSGAESGKHADLGSRGITRESQRALD